MSNLSTSLSRLLKQMQLWTNSVDYIKGEFIEPSALWNLCVKSANLLLIFSMFTACSQKIEEKFVIPLHIIAHQFMSIWTYCLLGWVLSKYPQENGWQVNIGTMLKTKLSQLNFSTKTNYFLLNNKSYIINKQNRKCYTKLCFCWVTETHVENGETKKSMGIHVPCLWYKICLL